MLIKNILEILLLFASMSALLAATPKRINCRKYVFAPICRGVAAKRLVSNLNEMLGDDPNVYAKEDIIPLQETDNQPKIDDTQGQWYMDDQRRHPDTYVEFEKKNRKTNSDYDAIVNMN